MAHQPIVQVAKLDPIGSIKAIFATVNLITMIAGQSLAQPVPTAA